MSKRKKPRKSWPLGSLACFVCRRPTFGHVCGENCQIILDEKERLEKERHREEEQRLYTDDIYV